MREDSFTDSVTDWLIPWSHLKIDKRLGAGSYKTVYKGTYLGAQVAIAEFKTSLDAAAIKEIEKEVNILRSIRHPNTLMFIGVTQEAGHFYIIMELAPLGCLLDLLQTDTPLKWSTRVRMAQEVAMALAYLHSKGIYHRDLKSENVLLFPGDHDGYTCKVADFGLSFLQEAGKKAARALKEATTQEEEQQEQEQEEAKAADPKASNKDAVKDRKKHLQKRKSFKLVPEELAGGGILGAKLVETNGRAALAQSKVGTFFTRAPEVDIADTYDPDKVDIFSFGIVLCELIVRGEGEDIRMEITYQKTDPSTGKKIIAFGVHADQLPEHLKPFDPPKHLVELATQCLQEDPDARPTLEQIQQKLDACCLQCSAQDAIKDQELSQSRFAKHAKLRAMGTLKDEDGASAWLFVMAHSGLLRRSEAVETDLDEAVRQAGVSQSDLWRTLRLWWSVKAPGTVFDERAKRFFLDVWTLKDAVKITLVEFASLWIILNPLWQLMKHPEIRWLWLQKHLQPFLTRTEAEDWLKSFPKALIIRYSPLRGAFTLSYRKKERNAHTPLRITRQDCICGTAQAARSFASVSAFLSYFDTHGFETLYCGLLSKPVALRELINGLSACGAEAEQLASSHEDGYSVGPVGIDMDAELADH